MELTFGINKTNYYFSNTYRFLIGTKIKRKKMSKITTVLISIKRVLQFKMILLWKNLTTHIQLPKKIVMPVSVKAETEFYMSFIQ